MRTKILTLFLLIFGCVSCDNSTPFVIDGEKVHTLHNQCGIIVVRGSSFSTSVMVACRFNGQYLINTDSLKIEAFSNEDMLTTIHFQLNNEVFIGKGIETKGGETLSFNFRLLPTVPYQRTTRTVLILPSNFITCEGKPIITDTIRIQLKN